MTTELLDASLGRRGLLRLGAAALAVPALSGCAALPFVLADGGDPTDDATPSGSGGASGGAKGASGGSAPRRGGRYSGQAGLTGRLWYQDDAVYFGADAASGKDVTRFVRAFDRDISEYAAYFTTASRWFVQYGMVRPTYADNRSAFTVYSLDDLSEGNSSTLEGYASQPAVSPDGRLVAMLHSTSYVDGIGENAVGGVAVVDMSRSEADVLLDEPDVSGGDRATALAWLPDGQLLVMHADTSLWRIDPARPGAPRRLGELEMPGGRTGIGMDLRPDGEQILVGVSRQEGKDERRDIHVFGVDGRHLGRATDDGFAYGATWSPDGSAFFYKSGGASVCDVGVGACMGSCDLWLLPADARDVRNGDKLMQDDGTSFPCFGDLWWTV